MGSAFGGEWRPKKPDDERFLGKPGEIKTTYDKRGFRIDTKIGEDGRAIRERHYTDHKRSDIHSNPHDHIINWNSPKHGKPNFEKPHINYWDGEIPEFKYFKGVGYMPNSIEDNRFHTISDFEDCIIRGGEVEFIWNDVTYTITHPEGRINISEAYKPETEKWCDTANQVLEYIINGKKLRDIITKIEVIFRSI
ncbi:hypothetical protein [Clostridium merdae]|uniref:hypothetical protein n=1 Tax=Clostridium merdae TaxID=1958780 RepID=UPI000A271CF9|nr:hypothetical protein [Clostridium merdae]